MGSEQGDRAILESICATRPDLVVGVIVQGYPDIQQTLIQQASSFYYMCHSMGTIKGGGGGGGGGGDGSVQYMGGGGGSSAGGGGGGFYLEHAVSGPASSKSGGAVCAPWGGVASSGVGSRPDPAIRPEPAIQRYHPVQASVLKKT